MDQRWGVVFQAAASSAVTSRQTAKRSSISVRHWVALSRCLRGRKGTVTLVSVGALEGSVG